jgi:DNA-binding CsgD family transcriptional regulator
MAVEDHTRARRRHDDPEPPSRALCAVIDEVLVPGTEEIAEEITAAIHRHRSSPGVDPEEVAETRASCRANLRLTLAMWRNGQDPREARPPEAAVAYARAYARQRRPLAGVLRAYRIGEDELTRIIQREVAARLPADEALVANEAASHFVFEWNDAILMRLEEAYDAEVELSSRGTTAARRRLIGEILDGEAIDLDDAGGRLGYDLRREHLCTVLWSASGAADLVEMEALAGRLAAAAGAPAPLTLPLGGLALAVWIGSWEPRALQELPAAAERTIAEAGGRGLRLALGTPRPGLAGFRRGHAEALHARRVAMVCRVAEPAVDYASVALASLLVEDLEHARGFVAEEIGPLLDGPRPDALLRLRETLEAYFAELCSSAATARRLGVHENTVQQRLARAGELLGHPPAERSLELQVALRLARLLPED